MKTTVGDEAVTSRGDSLKRTTNETRAREIMGKNFFGIEEVIMHFLAIPTRDQLAVISEVPFSVEVLHQCKDTHILVAVLPLSILEIREKVQDMGLFDDQDWYDEQVFATERGEAAWQLVRKTEVPDSTNKTWQEQQALLNRDEEVPNARVMAYAIIGHYLAAGERLFERICVRTPNALSNDQRVCVGDFDSEGLLIGDCWDGGRGKSFGVASARKFN